MMKRTYIVEFPNGDITEYCYTLKTAKHTAETYGGTRIITLLGREYGEGIHTVIRVLINGKWVKQK